MRKTAAAVLAILVLTGTAVGVKAEEKAYLGVSVRESDHPESGILILSVAPGSPAYIAGLRTGDRILTFQEGDPCGVACFGEKIRAAGPDTRLVIKFVRNGEPGQVHAVLGRSRVARFPAPPARLEFITEGEVGIEVPEALIRTRIDLLLSDMPEAPEPPRIFMSPASRIGLDLIQVTPELRSHLGGPEHAGLLVGSVQDDSPAEKAGIVAGDLLVEVEGRPVRGSDGWVILLNTIDRSSYEVGLVRDGLPKMVKVDLPERASRRDETALAVQNALKSIEFSLKSEEMSRELRDHLQAVREQLQRALNPPPKRPEPAPEPNREQDPAGR